MITHPMDKRSIYSILEEVNDPEIPVLSIIDLGIVRDVKTTDDEVEVIITPTYSGCPAMDVMSENIKKTLIAHGIGNVKVTSVLSPAWTTEWMSEEGKRKLKEFGIAPPHPIYKKKIERLFAPAEQVQCPHCNSNNTHRVSEFGSTACKALYVCDDCKEPFDYFKCH
ncbi:MAG: phenylacetate-CoA oxygenase subunit PaaJ [Chitinophagales bacterium]|nr:phenylacetate-CoA oxygenase subunit PaaJ [Chitinophagales bacterium]